MSYIPGLLSNGLLAPGLTPAAVRSTLDVPSNQDLTDAIDTVDLSGYLPLSGGTLDSATLEFKQGLANAIGNVGIVLRNVDGSISGFMQTIYGTSTAQFHKFQTPDSNTSLTQNEFKIGYASYLGFQSSIYAGPSAKIYGNTANTIEQRNGLEPQSDHVYNTYTSDTDYERGGLVWDTNKFWIRTANAGTGILREAGFDSSNRSAYIAAPTNAEIRDIFISFGMMEAS